VDKSVDKSLELFTALVRIYSIVDKNTYPQVAVDKCKWE
jgi:hypothetical protein